MPLTDHPIVATYVDGTAILVAYAIAEQLLKICKPMFASFKTGSRSGKYKLMLPNRTKIRSPREVAPVRR